MDSALSALITSAAGTGAPTNPSSRYYGSGIEQFALPSGTQVMYFVRHIIPQASRYPSTQTYVITDADRLDNLAATYLGDPLLYWMICDANSATDPDELTAQAGREIAIPVPGSATPVARAVDNPLYLSLMAGPVVAVPVPKALVDAFVSAEVTESAREPSGFQLTFTLADESILQTFLILTASAPIPLLRVIASVSFGGPPQVIIDGLIEHHEVQPDTMTGSSKLVVTGHDMSALMGLVELTGLPYPAMSPDLRVLLMLAKYAPFGIIPEVIPVPVPDISVPIQQIPVQQGTDLDYIKHLADEVGYVFYVTPGPEPGLSQAYWGPQVRIGNAQPSLNVNMDSWTNVESLNFRYEPQGSVLPIVFIQESLTGVTIPIPIPPVTPFNPPLGVAVPLPQQVHQLDDTAKRSPAEALMLGFAEAVKHADVVSVDGSLDVVRYGQILRARSLVGVRGAGLAFDGMHYVDQVTHNLKPGEYKQHFRLKRNALISDLPTVPASPY